MVKKITIVGGILLLIGVIGLIFTLPSMFKSGEIFEEKTVTNKNITEIAVQTDNGVVELLPAINDEIKVEVTGKLPKNKKYDFIVKEEGNTLNIGFKEKGWKLISFDFFSTGITVKVYLPKKTYESIQAETNNGRVYGTEIIANDIKIETDNGRVELKNVNGKTIHAKTNNGRIELNSVVATSINVHTDNGRIYLNGVEGKITGKSSNGNIAVNINQLDYPMDISTNNGKILIETKSEPNNATITADVDNGKIRIFGHSNHHTVFGEGENMIQLKTDNGNITVE